MAVTKKGIDVPAIETVRSISTRSLDDVRRARKYRSLKTKKSPTKSSHILDRPVWDGTKERGRTTQEKNKGGELQNTGINFTTRARWKRKLYIKKEEQRWRRRRSKHVGGRREKNNWRRGGSKVLRPQGGHIKGTNRVTIDKRGTVEARRSIRSKKRKKPAEERRILGITNRLFLTERKKRYQDGPHKRGTTEITFIAMLTPASVVAEVRKKVERKRRDEGEKEAWAKITDLVGITSVHRKMAPSETGALLGGRQPGEKDVIKP